ncbi:MAG TPA: hypothetical protein VNZ50_00275 [Hyphomicrobiaceae bacterium]|nr:hypothetical protein [Hyphomicrobiaceae bacterium]
MADEQSGSPRLPRGWRSLRGIGGLAALAAPLALATLVLAIWPVPQSPLQSEDFLLYGVSPGVTKVVDRLRDKDPTALVIYSRFFVLYVTVGILAAIGFIARGLRQGLKRGNRGDFGFLLFLQSPALLLFLDDRFMRGGRFGLAILAVLYCIMLPVFWLLSRHMLNGLEAFATQSKRGRPDE